MQKKCGKLIVISGFSGAGKGTIVKYLIDNYDDYALSISATSRNKRPTEEDGKHYFFITKTEFEDLISNDGLLEYTNYSGNYYGTPKSFVNEKLKASENVIRGRNTETEEQIKSRLKIALNEASGASKYDYVIINEDAEESAAIVNNIIRGDLDTINKINNDRPRALNIINEIKDSIEKFVR